MQKFLFPLFCFFFHFCLHAQEGWPVTVTVLNVQQQPVESATVEMRKLPDSSLVKVQMTDVKGKASFIVNKESSCFFKISHTGFVGATTQVLFIKNEMVLPPVLLQASGSELAGVTVASRKPVVEIKPGKMIVNVEAQITSAGTTVMEALEKMPGVTVDKDGNISLKGKAGVLVMIDGKQTYLDAAQLATLLNGMSSSQVSQVEIMEQPSAAFDAAGNAGVINIKTKKSVQRGFTGSLTTAYSQGMYPKNNNSLQLSFRSGKWNFFGSYSANFNTSFTRVYALRSYFKTDGRLAALLEQPSFFKGRGQTQNLRVGVDYSINPKTSIGLTLSGLSLNRKGANTNQAFWLNSQKQTDSLIQTQGISENDWKNAGVSLNFKHSFTTSRELTSDVDVVGYKISGHQFFENKLLFPGSYSEAIRASIPSQIQILSAKTDYMEQLKNVRIQSGLKVSRITTDNLAAYEIKDGDLWREDDGKSNHFLYTENIRAAYTSAEMKRKRWSLQAGIRFEATSYDARQLGNKLQKDSSFSRSYNNLFPTFLTSFEADSNNTFSLTAGRRIDRPDFQKLNPFVLIINKYTFQKGNPFFKPQFTWNIELNHVYKSRIVTGVGYSLTTDYFSQIFPVESNGQVIYTEGNLGKLQQFTFSIGAQFSPSTWWSLSAQAVGTHKKMEGVIGKRLQATITQFTLNANNQFRMKKGWSGELSGFYTSRSQADIQEIVDPAGQLSIGIAKTILQNKGTLKLSVRDILYTQWMKGDTYFPQAHESFKLTRDTRVAQLSFTYRFGKMFKAAKRSEGAAGEEIRRVGNG